MSPTVAVILTPPTSSPSVTRDPDRARWANNRIAAALEAAYERQSQSQRVEGYLTPEESRATIAALKAEWRALAAPLREANAAAGELLRQPGERLRDYLARTFLTDLAEPNRARLDRAQELCSRRRILAMVQREMERGKVPTYRRLPQLALLNARWTAERGRLAAEIHADASLTNDEAWARACERHARNNAWLAERAAARGEAITR